MAYDEEKIPTGSNNSGNVIGWLERLLKLKKDYGLGNILTSIMILFITIVMGVVAFKPSVIVEEVQKIQTEQHNRAVDKRIKADPQIREALTDLRLELGADRTFIVEAHNGGTNLTSLPFLYVDMTYESTRNGMFELEEEYKNLRLQRYNFCTFLYQNNYWYGNTEELMEIDPSFAYRIEGDGVKYIGVLAIYGQYTIIGAIGVEYGDSEPADPNTVRIIMHKYGSRFAILLNNETSLKATKKSQK